ncbi:MAG TPA: ferrochelatase [Longimicrobiales bacterium]|nr:ferrochelatase [Longimicrobiales bacterium]
MSARTGVVLLNFGEPENPEPAEVVPFLERIFRLNANLEGAPSPEAAHARARQLAELRAPGLVDEYRDIGGSPMNSQSRAQGEAVRQSLARRGLDVRVYCAFQFTAPLPDEIVERARADGVARLIALPVYPLCGPSTTIAALAALRHALERAEWNPEVQEISGWHPHPDYVRLRAEGIVETARVAGVSLSDPRVALVFSAHGTPLKYLREGSRYDRYVEQSCAAVAAAAGCDDHVIGYQNHTNRPLEWTQPDIQTVIAGIDADHVVVVPISFMHEQSETLAELDHELRGEAETRGLGFHRVRVPHDDPRFAGILADLCEPFVRREAAARRQVPSDPVQVPNTEMPFRACLCRGVPGALCLNGRP